MTNVPENYDVLRGEDGKYITTRFCADDCGASWIAFGVKHDRKYQAIDACIEDAAEYNYI